MINFFFQAEDGIRDLYVTGVQTCALPISISWLAGQGSAPELACCIYATAAFVQPEDIRQALGRRSEERRVGKECRARWWPGRANEKDRHDFLFARSSIPKTLN